MGERAPGEIQNRYVGKAHHCQKRRQHLYCQGGGVSSARAGEGAHHQLRRENQIRAG